MKKMKELSGVFSNSQRIEDALIVIVCREFTHRVKSVSMAKFTSQEVSSLQEGGNKRAKEIYFKQWDSQRHSIPDSSNVERLRDFIKHAYVDRRFSGERNFDKPPLRANMDDKKDSNENRRANSYRGGSRSPPYEDTHERRCSDRSSPGGRSYGERSPGYDEESRQYGDYKKSPGGRSYGERSPGFSQESRQYGDYKKSPSCPDVVNDWRREDRFGNGQRSEDRRMSDGDAKLEGRSPERSKDVDESSPPMVRPVREILGDNIVPLRISEPPKANGSKGTDGFVHTQRTSSSTSLESTNGNPTEVKWESSGSLIDFDADPEPSVAAAVPQIQQPATVQAAVVPPTDNNWASFDLAPETKVTQAPSNILDSVLSQLSAPSSVPGHLSGLMGGIGARTTGPAHSNLLSVGGDATSGHNLPFSVGAPAAVPNSSWSTFASDGSSAAVPGLMQMLPSNGGQRPTMQHQQPSMYPEGGIQSHFTPFGGGTSHQPWNSLPAPNAQGLLSIPLGAPPAVSTPVQDLTSDLVSQTPMEVKSSERKLLPEDLFSVNYSSMSAPIPGWHAGSAHGAGFSVHYNMGATLPIFPQSSNSTNPFDVGSEPPQVQAPTFPSMVSMQGSLPNAPPPSNLPLASSLGNPSLAWMQPQPSAYASASTPQAPPYAPALPPRPYMGQVPADMLPSRPQGLGSVNSDQQMAGRYSAPATPNSYSSFGGNPFG